MASARAAFGRGPDVDEVRDLRIDTRAGSIAARLFRPAIPIGLILYLHGGGWVLGTLDDFDAVARCIAARSRCAVLLPDYRLAPEDPFPAGLEDAEDALLFAGRHKSAFGAPGAPLVLAGDSAGANLAIAAAVALQGRVPLRLQVLNYPVAGCELDTPSYRHYAAGFGLTRRDMEWFFEQYAPQSRQDPRVSPLNIANLAGLPPALVVTAEYDVLRDEGEAFARRLAEAGIPTRLNRYDGLTHGFLRMHNLVDAADAALSEIAAAIAEACLT